MTEGCIDVSVEDPGIPDVSVGCCEQGPPGPPGPTGPPGPMSSDDSVADIVTLTQAEYDLLAPPESDTLYLICDGAP